MDDSPLVSILTPTYNHEKYIGQCIQSVLDQTYGNWEQIIVDDGSTDATYEEIRKYDDNRIKYIRQDNRGIWKLHETYNKALEKSRGELIAVLEGDDYWPTKKLENQIKDFKDKDIILSWGRAGITDECGKIMTIIPRNIKFNKERSQLETIKDLLKFNFIIACTVMIKKDPLLSIGGFSQATYTPYVDYPTWLNLSLKGKFCPNTNLMGYWRQHNRQATKMLSNTMLGCSNHYAIEFLERIPNNLRGEINITSNQLHRRFNDAVGSSYFYHGRIALCNKDWDNAMLNFKMALVEGSNKTKIISIVGILFCKLQINMEPIAAIWEFIPK